MKENKINNKKYKKCEIEFVNDIESNIKVKSLTFKPSRMKKKEELRRMAKNIQQI